MRRLKSILGYTAAAVAILVMVATVAAPIMGLGITFLAATGLKLSANWSGGEVVRTVDHGAYRTEIHRPVFDALIGERSDGFVQVAWRPSASLPAQISEEVDADADGRADFRVDLDTRERRAALTSYSAGVRDLEGVFRLGETLAVRVNLENLRR
jgi:hypothetical protein